MSETPARHAVPHESSSKCVSQQNVIEKIEQCFICKLNNDEVEK